MRLMLRFFILFAALQVIISSAFAQEGPTRVSNKPTGGRVVFDSSFVRFYGMNGWDNIQEHKQYTSNLSIWLGHDENIPQKILFYNTFQGKGYDNWYFKAAAPVVLQAKGDTVTVTTRSATPVLTDELLSNYDQLWVINGQVNSTGAFSAAELDAISAFLDAGNGLLLISDHENRVNEWDRSWAGDVGQIASLFNVSYLGFVDRYHPIPVTAPDFEIEHPLWKGVGFVWGGTDSEIDNENPLVQIVAAPNGSPMVAVLDLGVPEVEIDIKPNSCPNPLNVKSYGVVPVAIMGSEDVDVYNINTASISLEGVTPLRVDVEDVAGIPMDGCSGGSADGYEDLALKFDKKELVAAIETRMGRTLVDGEELILTLIAELNNGRLVAGEDGVVIRRKGK